MLSMSAQTTKQHTRCCRRLIDTLTIAGSWVTAVCCSEVAFGGSQTWRSLMSLPRKMMYSNTSSRGGTGWSVGRSSVPNDFTATQRTISYVEQYYYNLWLVCRVVVNLWTR